jgi:catechol 2,3-dioxygenase-like lactoylglutathione lyase family enzyme
MMMLAIAMSAAVRADAAQPLPMKGIHHIGITVSDIDTTLAFYGKAIPYRLQSRYRVPAAAFPSKVVGRRRGEVEIAIVRMPTMFIQLIDIDPDHAAAPDPRPVIGPGYTHICFQSPATNSAYDKFRAAGLQMVSRGDKPVDIGGYGVLYAYGRDPDGIMIETEVMSDPKRPEPAWVTHIANVVADRDRMLGFYSKLLGQAPYRTVEQENRKPLDDIANIDNLSIKGGWFRLANMEIEVWQYARPQTPTPVGDRTLAAVGYNAIGFEVANLARETARLRRLGVRLAGRPMKLRGWRVQYAYDPEGNLFSVQQNVGAPGEESIDAILAPRA